MEFDFRAIEQKWRKEWEKNRVYEVTEDTTKPKYYVLDMFPYPSGAGLHVGHPLGYVASDIYARYKRLKGFNVLHPMGFDAFGLPAEQYAIETGTPPQVTTDKAIATYKEQLGKIGFSYDWSREVKTCDPSYYKWTQWIFLQLFGSWYNREKDKAENIDTLIARFAQSGTEGFAQFDKEDHAPFTAAEWKGFSEEAQQHVLMHYRLAYQSYSEVNWCEALGTVLANDEVKDGKSERGGYPVERRKMRQWFLRITEYSDRLLRGLDTLDWSEAMKDMQRNWIGRSEGAIIQFHLSQTLSKGEGFNTSVVSDADSPRYNTTDQLTWKANIDNAKANRSGQTQAEDIVWQRLRANALGYRFRRQHLIGSYIPDFVCLKKALVVEIDGGIHNEQKEADEQRTKELNEQGFKVIRFTNEEVISNIDSVIASIQKQLDTLPDRGEVQDENEDVLAPSPSERAGGEVAVFTTRPDTIFGATFMVIAPEHELVASLTTSAQQKEVDDYIAYVKSRSDIERQQEKRVTGAFTGSYALNPFNGARIPIYLAEYVLAGYGTGAIMAVPADDERDRKFAEKFGLPVVEVIDKSMYPGATIEDKVGKMINSDFLNGMEVKDAIKAMLEKVEELGIGKRQVNYRQRDAGYSRQRYWGEPFPIVYKGDLPYPLPVSELPVVLPDVTSYKPSGDGRSPLANATEWVNTTQGQRETDTMPGYAGSSWYFLRYMDPQNPDAFAAKEKIDYWQNVDLYLGGSEHAVGHLLYSRMWHKFLYDLGYVPTEEPFQKLVNQGMIQGVSANLFLHRFDLAYYDNEGKLRTIGSNLYLSKGISQRIVSGEIAPDEFQDLLTQKFGEDFLKDHPEFKTSGLFVNRYVEGMEFYDAEKAKKRSLLKVPIDIVGSDDVINLNKLREWRSDYKEAYFVTEDKGQFIVGREVEKMSKSKYNVVNPDDVIAKYGADCFRMFEMFLGPLDQSKPWDDQGIGGVEKFLRKFWRLFNLSQTLSEGEGLTANVSDDQPTDTEFKVLHKTLKKLSEDIERLAFNTCVSQFMICTNELIEMKCTKRAILEPLVIALAPFAPFISEELWASLGHNDSVHKATFPAVEEKYLVESSFTYPISINGKVRANLPFALDLSEADVKAAVLANDIVLKWTEGKEPKKFIFVKGRIVNVVI
ncbi:MAG: leucine--tRNA ligase [Bacteroidetes bacterium]|nr:leucine--tRNA ligase [Bacteroidota bacterium]